jgi:molybdopterin-guanine dinucleotide biosynthesis protein A
VDPVDDAGPLRGVLTALDHSTTPIVVVIAIDIPGIDRQKLAWMAESLVNRPNCRGLMCRTKSNSGHTIEPFPSAFRTNTSPIIAGLFQLGRRSVYGLCDDPAFIAIDPPDDWPRDFWTNLNKPSQFKAYELQWNLEPSES